MSALPEDKRFAPPTARVDDLVSGEQQLGGRWARFGAAFIDGLLQGAIYAALVYGVFPALKPDATGFHVGVIAVQLVLTVLIFMGLQGYLLNKYGQTLGKRLLHLRIVRSDGSPAALGRLLGLRYFIGWLLALVPIVGMIYVLVDLLLIFRASHQCLHDNIADTIVIKA